ncbi:transmembrane protein 174 [Gastrophryne carolinensis]
MELRSSPVDDFPLPVCAFTPHPNSQADAHISEKDKAGATMLFSGVFLGLVGITFTVMGWVRRDDNHMFEWTQLFGPVLISVGVTFALISVCKFNMLSCKTCKANEDVALELDHVLGGQSFVFTGLSQPITFHGATVVQYIPPACTAQEAIAMTSSSPTPVFGDSSSSISGVTPSGPPIHPPLYHSIYTVDNPGFTEDGTSKTLDHGHASSNRSPVYRIEPSVTMHRSPPPSYDEIVLK